MELVMQVTSRGWSEVGWGWGWGGAGTSGEKAYLKVNSAATKHKEPSRGTPREHHTGRDY